MRKYWVSGRNRTWALRFLCSALTNNTFLNILIQAVDPEQAEKVGQFVDKLKTYRSGDNPFTFVLDDISGNSFVENPHAPNNDEAMTITKYDRTKEQNQALGFEESDGNYFQKKLSGLNYLSPSL